MPPVPDPIFGELDEVKQTQRMSGIHPDTDPDAQFNLAVIEARNEFYMRLGRNRIVTLEALEAPESDTAPADDNGYLWLLGYATEQKLIRRVLLRYFTRLLKDGNAGRVFQEWNDISAFREMSQRSAQDELDRLDGEIERAFAVLGGAMQPGAVSSIRAKSIGSELEDQYRIVGNSLRSYPPYLFAFRLDTSNAENIG